jgi:hypothetical protein
MSTSALNLEYELADCRAAEKKQQLGTVESPSW